VRRYKLTVDVTETYEIIVDAYDEEEACDGVYEMPVHEIMEGDYLDTEVEISHIEEVRFEVEE